ncbi:MAG: serine/threonine protein kinase, partial [Rhodothermales bacterium]|nr:serine/threonine protein kinase [Rhodothermales bacterium]
MRPFAELARGTTTTVLKAHDPERDRVVVVKLLRREWAQDEEISARFAAETAALYSVSNDNVVSILDHGECEEGLFIVTDYVEGAALDGLLGDRTIPTIIGAFIVREALSGLAAVSQAGIVHRDFKSSNIVVSDQGLVQLVDFGFAESTADTHGAVAGTLGYIAPELLAGEAATEQSDIYSAGITLFEATTGVSVSGRATLRNGRQSYAHLNSGALTHIDENLSALIGEMTDPSPANRPATVDQAIGMLDEVLADYRPAVSR